MADLMSKAGKYLHRYATARAEVVDGYTQEAAVAYCTVSYTDSYVRLSTEFEWSGSNNNRMFFSSRVIPLTEKWYKKIPSKNLIKKEFLKVLKARFNYVGDIDIVYSD